MPSTKREQAEEFWNQYDIPFAFDTAIKGRLSGLSRGSTGTGHARDTVIHLYTEEAFTDGRLSRDEGEYLCDPGASPSFEFAEERHVEDGEEYMPAVTCSTCLDRMARWEVE